MTSKTTRAKGLGFHLLERTTVEEEMKNPPILILTVLLRQGLLAEMKTNLRMQQPALAPMEPIDRETYHRQVVAVDDGRSIDGLTHRFLDPSNSR